MSLRVAKEYKREEERPSESWVLDQKLLALIGSFVLLVSDRQIVPVFLCR